MTRPGVHNSMHDWRFKLFVDGACPICRREGELFRRLDRGRGRLIVEDITVATFDPREHGLTMGELMNQIHGVTPDRRVYRGMEALRRAYDAVGFGLLLAPTRLPLVRQITDTSYRWFARNRLRLPGRRHTCETDCRHC